MDIEARRADDPTSLSLLEFVRRAARLPVKDLIDRGRHLSTSLPKNILTVSRLTRRLKQEDKKPVFVLLTGRMGDLIAAEPVIRHIKQPDDYILWLCRPRYAEVLRFNNFVDKTIPVSSDFEADLLQKIFSRQRWVNLLLDGTLCNVFGIRLWNRNPIGINANNRFAFGSNTDVFALLGTGRILNEKPRLYVDPAFDAASFIAHIFPDKAPFLIFHPTSDEFARSWSSGKAKEFANWLLEATPFSLIETGMSPVLAPGPRVFTMADFLAIPQQMSVIAHASVFVGVDSGFSHIANAWAVPSVLLLGEHLGFKTHLPLAIHDHDIIVRGPGQTHEISVAAVSAAVSRILEFV